MGCGAGGAAMIAHRYHARITGIDAASALIAVAQERIPSAKFQVGELEELPYPDASFDVVFSSNSLQYAAHPPAALNEFVRVLDNGGRIAIVIWGRPEDCEMDSAVFPAVRKLMPPPPAGTPQPLALSDPNVLNQLLHQVKLTVTASEFVDVPMEYANMEDAWRAQKSAGPIQGGIRAAGEDVVRKAVVEAMRPYTSPSGIIRMRNKFRVVIAARE
ncbi:MAG: class I SAM-dependent methyltransferase [Nitrososphaerota archaeon]|nr:class I SAM-dependent methyltransferase [Nitrososphaerota archaeon]